MHRGCECVSGVSMHDPEMSAGPALRHVRLCRSRSSRRLAVIVPVWCVCLSYSVEVTKVAAFEQSSGLSVDAVDVEVCVGRGKDGKECKP